MFTTSTTVFNELVKRNHVPEALGNPIKNQALTVIASNGFLTEAFDECDESRIKKAIAFTVELRSENKSAGPNAVDGTDNLKNILERRLADRSKPTANFLIPPIDFIEEHTTLFEKATQKTTKIKNQFG